MSFVPQTYHSALAHPETLFHSANFLVDEVYLRRNYKFTDEQMRDFSLGGKDTPLESLGEDLYISQAIRDEIQKVRRGE